MPSIVSHLRQIGVISILSLSLCWSATASAEEAKIRMGTKPSEVMVAKIAVSDLRRSLDYYTKVVGLKEFTLPGVNRPNVDDAKATGQVYLNFSGSPAEPFLALMKFDGVALTPETVKVTSVCFKVADTRTTLARAKEAGSTIVLDATDFMGALVALVRDPDGYTIEFTQAETFASASSNSKGKTP